MFYGRLESYAAALDHKDRDELAAALMRNFHPQADDPTALHARPCRLYA